MRISFNPDRRLYKFCLRGDRSASPSAFLEACLPERACRRTVMKVQKNIHSFSFRVSLSAPTCNLATCAASYDTPSISSPEGQLRYSDQLLVYYKPARTLFSGPLHSGSLLHQRLRHRVSQCFLACSKPRKLGCHSRPSLQCYASLGIQG